MPLAGCNIFPGAPIALGVQGAANVSCPSGTNTTVFSSGGASGSVVAQNPGPLIPVIQGVGIFSLGATPPTALTLSYGTTLGTALNTLTVAAQFLNANAVILVPFYFVGPATQTGWQAGLTPLIWANPTAQTVTLLLNSSNALFALLPGGA